MRSRLPPPSKVVEVLREAKTVDAAAKKLGLDPDTLYIYLSVLASQGKVRLELVGRYRCNCSRCPLRDKCILPWRKT